MSSYQRVAHWNAYLLEYKCRKAPMLRKMHKTEIEINGFERYIMIIQNALVLAEICNAATMCSCLTLSSDDWGPDGDEHFSNLLSIITRINEDDIPNLSKFALAGILDLTRNCLKDLGKKVTL